MYETTLMQTEISPLPHLELIKGIREQKLCFASLSSMNEKNYDLIFRDALKKVALKGIFLAKDDDEKRPLI